MSAGQDHLRVSDADRAHAVDQLRRAAEEGGLSPADLDRRTELARRAVTRGDLAAALVPDGPAGLVPPGYRPDDPLVLSAGVSTEKREGAWTVPPYLRVQALVDNVRLNCLLATPTAQVVDLEVLAGAGTVILVLPPGWAVNTDRLNRNLGTVKVTVPSTPAAGCPVFVVRGSLGLGTFRAREPNRWERKRAGLPRPLS